MAMGVREVRNSLLAGAVIGVATTIDLTRGQTRSLPHALDLLDYLHVPPAPHAVPWLAELAERNQRVMAQHPHVAGLVLSAPPGISPPRPTLEAGLITTGATLLDSTAGTTLRRHTLLIPRDRHDAPTLTHWLAWYRTESDWLNWAWNTSAGPPSTDLFASNARSGT